MNALLSEQGLRAAWETFESEQLKEIAGLGLHVLGGCPVGRRLITLASGGERVMSPRLHTELAGMSLENPVLVGAGWDKKGWAVDGLYALGFAGTEVGSVLAHPQEGNPRPRMWYRRGAALNRLGFNSPGMEQVAKCLSAQERPGIVGVSIGKNKLTPDDQAPWAHAAVARGLYDYADYFVVNVASPNTPGLRNLLKPGPLTDIVLAVKEALCAKGAKPLFVKTTVDLSLQDLEAVIKVCLENGVTGIVDSNSTVDDDLKSLYGWQGEEGGLSGDVGEFRQRANERMKVIFRLTKGTELQRIGVGAINSAASAIERLQAGAQAVQVVTGIRQRKARIARDINQGILDYLSTSGHENVQEIVGEAS
ncbi:MAG: dihydroorotate dehydrogenase (quinone) [Acidimicrobiales bacterium]|jgi:dihydroorotate dehydrogenase